LDSEDEELEIIPHIKGSTDFEIYDQVVIKPTFTVLPWDDNVKPNYTLNYKVSYFFTPSIFTTNVYGLNATLRNF
jgi:hypothetical protein